MKPHKHAEVIKAWADGAKIEYRNRGMKNWEDMPECSPLWFEDVEYRVKPEDVVHRYNVSSKDGITYLGAHGTLYNPYNLVLFFDAETGKLKAAEVIE
jgi:hypothetical protein